MEDNKYIEELIVKFLDGSIDPSEKKILHEWLMISKENQQLFMDYSNIWATGINLNAEESFESLVKRIHKHSTKRVSWLRPVSIVASIAAAVTLVLLFLNDPKPIESSEIAHFAQKEVIDISTLHDVQLTLSDEKTVYLSEKESSVKYDETENISVNNETTIAKQETAKYNQLITPRGKRSSIVFSDGTVAKVNTGTRLVYPVDFDQHQREIYVDGEIYLDVKPDKNRPFVVKTKNTDVRVLGTSFNVSAYEDEALVEVVLVSGTVKVEQKEGERKSETLKPLQKYSSENGGSVTDNVDVNKYVSWVQGLYIFEGERLDVILNRLVKYYGINIKYDKNIATILCSGKLDLKDNPDAVLKSLESTAPIIYLTVADGEYFIKSKK